MKIKKEKINIRSNSDDKVARILSNLAETPFEYEGILFTSVESALQGIKFKDKQIRNEVFSMGGLDALKKGREVTENIDSERENFVYWKGKEIKYNSQDHRLLLASFIREKIRQNKEVMEALLSTKDFFIYHDVGEESPNTSLPEKFYMEILLSERRLLERLDNIK